MLLDTEFKGEGPAPSGSRPPLARTHLKIKLAAVVEAAVASAEAVAVSAMVAAAAEMVVAAAMVAAQAEANAKAATATKHTNY